MYSITVMIHASNWREGLDWYQSIFPGCIRHQETDGEFEFISVGEFAIEVVQADSKVSSGCAGTVVYWQTNDFNARLRFLLSKGATLFRGPMDLKNGVRMCQVLDPFGNPFGIRGYSKQLQP